MLDWERIIVRNSKQYLSWRKYLMRRYFSQAYIESLGHRAGSGGRVTRPFMKTCPFIHEMSTINVCEINPCSSTNALVYFTWHFEKTIWQIYEHCMIYNPTFVQWKKYTGAQGKFAPEMPKRAPVNLHRVQCNFFLECYFYAGKLEK